MPWSFGAGVPNRVQFGGGGIEQTIENEIAMRQALFEEQQRQQGITEQQRVEMGLPSVAAQFRQFGLLGADPTTGMMRAQQAEQMLYGGDMSTSQVAAALDPRNEQIRQLALRQQEAATQAAEMQLTAARADVRNPLKGLSFQDQVKMQETITGLEQGIADVQTLTGLLDAYPTAGSLLVNPEARGTARQAMVGTAAAINSVLDLGALTSDEREFLFDMQNNPDSVLGRLTSNDAYTRSLYAGLIDRLENRRRALVGMLERRGVLEYFQTGDIISPFAIPADAGDVVQSSGSMTQDAVQSVSGDQPQSEVFPIYPGIPLN